jgi:hypothetical protein
MLPSIKLTNAETGEIKQAKSNNQGYYSLPYLNPDKSVPNPFCGIVPITSSIGAIQPSATARCYSRILSGTGAKRRTTACRQAITDPMNHRSKWSGAWAVAATITKSTTAPRSIPSRSADSTICLSAKAKLS